MEMKSWKDSKTIRFLALTWLAGMLLQLVPMLQAHSVDWYDLGAQSISTLAAVIIRMAQDDVQAPIGLLNKGNPQP